MVETISREDLKDNMDQGEDFVLIGFQLKNNSKEGLDLSARSLAPFDGDGRRFKSDTDTYFI